MAYISKISSFYGSCKAAPIELSPSPIPLKKRRIGYFQYHHSMMEPEEEGDASPQPIFSMF